MNLRNEAEELAIALEYGIATSDEAVEWADSWINILDDPPYALIEVSTSGRSPIPEVMHLLRAVPGEVDVAGASRAVIARMASALRHGDTTAEAVAQILDAMQLVGRVPDDEAFSDMVRLDDAFFLAHQGVYGTVDDARRELWEFLGRYEGD